MRPVENTIPGVTPAMPRRGGMIFTATGVNFYPMDPRVDEIRLRDIAVALGKICRWGGHVPGDRIFSVAQHSVLVCLAVPHRFRVQALLHDAHEAYICDVPKPLKRYLVNYEVAAARLDACIGDRFGVELCDLPREVEEADARSLVTERRDLLMPHESPLWEPKVKPWMSRIVPWDIPTATESFFNLALKLGLS
jgi:uncharacterized protein